MMLQKPYLIVVIIFVTLIQSISAQTFRDNFNVVSYGNNNGSQNFSGNWIEQNDDGSPSGGRISINSNQLRFNNIDNRAIYRFVPLAGASSATLTLDYDATSRGNESLQVFIYNPDANTFNLISTINTSNSGSITYDLSAAEIASNPAIFLNGADTNWGNGEIIFIDNVQFSTGSSVPEILVNDVTVNEEDGTAIFTVTHSGPNISGVFTVDYATASGSANAGLDYITETGTLNFNGTSGDTETITITIIDDTIIDPLLETFSIILSNPSDTSVIVSDIGTGTIRDNDAILVSNGGSISTCSNTLLDSGGISGNYNVNEDFTITICPDTPGKNINIDFSSFSTENNFDFLYIYQGISTSGTPIGTYDGDLGSFSVTSLDSSGCLTLRFTSDEIITSSGWDATISCLDKAPTLVVEDITVNEGDGTAVFTVTHTDIVASGPFDVTFQTQQGTAVAGDDYSTTTGTISFNGTLGDTETITVPIIDDANYGELNETFTVEFLTTTDTNVNITDTATGFISDNEVILNDVPLTLYNNLSGNYDYVSTGGSLRTNSNSTDPCAIATTSSNTLTSIVDPTGKNVVKAYLYWAHSSSEVDQDVTLEGTSVSADLVYGALDFGGLQFYGYIADITDIIAGMSNPWTETYDFSGLTIDNSDPYCDNTVVLGAWSLMIFYEDLTLPSSTINLYYGFDVTQNAGTSFTLDNFFAISPTGSKATFLSYEGDATLDGTVGDAGENEELSITTQGGITTILTGDGGQTGNNPYNSTIYDNTVPTPINITDSYGLDLDTFDIASSINNSDTEVTANVNARQDLIFSSAVVIKVPSNLISGVVFEDVNYPGGLGRTQASSSGIGIEGATIELYNSFGTLIQTAFTDEDGIYAFGGMPDGTYTIRVVNSTVTSNRGGGSLCTTCYAVQTFRSSYNGTSLINETNEVGGAFPSSEDVTAGNLIGAQTSSTVVIAAGGTGNIDFGFNFNTIVNTNEDGQGSLEQFIINSNNLDETGLDIEANSIFDPASGVDTSIFMIPPTGDSQGRTADVNYNGAYFDIFIGNGNPLTSIIANNTSIDGRTQTAYSGNTNSGTIGSGGTAVGTTGVILPNYNLPEIQIHRNSGDVLVVESNGTTIRNLSVFANNNAAIQVNSGSVEIAENVLGVDATGNNAGNIDFGIENQGGDILVSSNYIATVTDAGIYLNGGASNVIENNHFFSNGATACDDNIEINSGGGIVIQQNLIENSASLGIDAENIAGNIVVLNNTITGAGQNGGNCTGSVQNYGIRLSGSNSEVSNNIIFSNGGSGLIIVGNSGDNGNRISQNSFFNNGTATAALGIDLVASGTTPDGVTINDLNDADTGPNDLINFPIIESANTNNINITVSGWARPGAIIEFFVTDISEGTALAGDNQLGLFTDYGEGQVFIGSFVEGSVDDTNNNALAYLDEDNNTDNTNQFTFIFSAPPGVVLGDYITATTTISNSTSEFAPISVLKTYTVITNRRITYRVKKN